MNVLRKIAATGAILSLLSTGQVWSREANLSADQIERVNAGIDADTGRLVEIFKDIHANPELGFMEVRTAPIVANKLEALGYEVKTGIGVTGVVGIMENGEGPIVMYRADMDANPGEEETGLPYASNVRVQLDDGTETPVAHLCGYDAHTTWLISVAKTMADLREEWSGTLLLVAQPAEEPIEGATAMVNDGLFEEHGVPVTDYVLGLHTASIPTGTMVGSAGVLMAGTEQLDVIFHSVWGHAARRRNSRRIRSCRVPFANHQPTYLVDLEAIPFGAKVGAVMVMELMASP